MDGSRKNELLPTSPCPPKADPPLAEKGEGFWRSGQAMLIAVLALGGAMLGATTIAGFLMAYQIRQTTDFENSAKAVFAADGGTEWGLYQFYINSSTPIFTLGNGTTVAVRCYDSAGNMLSCGDPSDADLISKGTSGETARAFQVTL